QGMPAQQAADLLHAGRGGQFDAQLIPVFLDLLQQGALQGIMGHSDESIPLQTCPSCGPTVVRRREQQPGEQVFCRNCGGGFKLHQGDHAWEVVPLQRKGRPDELITDPDHALIERTVAAMAESFPAQA
ncbi:MAG: phosphohydrolase, partial [Pseudomonadales bacterium]|nr:phosphohydrolase [Pseudomonadales bacterium]